MDITKSLFVKDTQSGDLCHFPAKGIAKMDTSDKNMRIFAGNCVIHHRIGFDKRWSIRDYCKSQATAEEKRFICDASGLWNVDPNEMMMALSMEEDPSSSSSVIIQGRVEA